jgi:hypothetical protein
MDIVERLRVPNPHDVRSEAADEIERLREGQPCSHKEYLELLVLVKKQSDEIERLREALKLIAEPSKIIAKNEDMLVALQVLLSSHHQIARAALKGDE